MAQHVSEATALLTGPKHHGVDDTRASSRTDPDVHTDTKAFPPSYSTSPLTEVKLLARSVPPLMLTYILQYSSNITSTIVAGHLGTFELGAISLATMTANVTGLAIYEGLATSLDTLCSQAYGSGNKTMVGLHLQRMVYLMWLVTVPIGVVWVCSPWILGALLPEKDLGVLAGSYLRVYLIGAPGYATFEAAKRFVQAQGRFEPPLFVMTVGAPLNVFLNWVFVWKLHLGLRGTALAFALTNLTQPLLLLLYVRYVIPSTLLCWPGLTRSAFRNWTPMLRLAMPGILMTEAEWLAFEILTFSSAYLGKSYLAAQSVLTNIGLLLYRIPFAASIAASTRLGNLIGGGALSAAKIAVRTYYMIFILIGLFDMGVLIALKGVIPKVFSKDEVVNRLVEMVMPLCASVQLLDSTTALCNGLLRGLGRQNIGGWANLMAYYVFSIPTSLFLTYGPPHLSLWGIWAGPAAGLGIFTVIISTFIKLISWEKCAEEARTRSLGT